MHPATHPRPVRLIVEIDPGQVSSLVQQLVDRFTTPSTVAPPRPKPDPDDQEDDEPAPARNLPPPVAHSPPLPVLPPPVAKTRYLGKPCQQGHTYQGSPYNLRKRSNHGCVTCAQIRDLVRKQEKARRPLAPVTALPTTTGTRPALPSHWEGRGFLSPVLCTEPTHRYQDRPYTLRYLESELCVQCCVQEHPTLALAGD